MAPTDKPAPRPIPPMEDLRRLWRRIADGELDEKQAVAAWLLQFPGESVETAQRMVSLTRSQARRQDRIHLAVYIAACVLAATAVIAIDNLFVIIFGTTAAAYAAFKATRLWPKAFTRRQRSLR